MSKHSFKLPQKNKLTFWNQWKVSRPAFYLFTSLVLRKAAWGLHLLQSAIHGVNFSLYFTLNSPVNVIGAALKQALRGRKGGWEGEKWSYSSVNGAVSGVMGLWSCDNRWLYVERDDTSDWPICHQAQSTNAHPLLGAKNLLLCELWSVELKSQILKDGKFLKQNTAFVI